MLTNGLAIPLKINVIYTMVVPRCSVLHKIYYNSVHMSLFIFLGRFKVDKNSVCFIFLFEVKLKIKGVNIESSFSCISLS